MTTEELGKELEESPVFARLAGGLLWCRLRQLCRENPRFRWALRGGLAGIGVATLAMLGTGSYFVVRAYSYDLARVAEFGGSIRVLDVNLRTVGAIGNGGRILLNEADLPDHFVDALLAAEDSDFYRHGGVDLPAIFRSAWINLRKGEIDQGGSTITQQLARNTFPLGGRTLGRKVLEMIIATRIERRYSKGEILCHYVNRIYFGSGFHGLGAAANGYFGKEADELSLDESALLVGLIRSPNRLSPLNDPEAADRARRHVLRRMVEEGALDGEGSGVLMSGPVKLAEGTSRRGRSIYLLKRVEEELNRLAVLDGVRDAFVTTSIDLKLQAAAESALRQGIVEAGPRWRESGNGEGDEVQGACLVVQHGTGRIMAAVPSRDHRESHYDRIRLSRRPPGFAFAPIVYAAAYESGVATPASGVLDVPMDNRLVMLGGMDGVLGEWSMVGAERRYLGDIPSGKALVGGRHAATVRLGFEVGLERVRAITSALGIEAPLRPYPSTFLGASEMSLEELVGAYAAIGNGGRRCRELTLVDGVFSPAGERLFRRNPEGAGFDLALSPLTAGRLKHLLRESLAERAGHGGDAAAPVGVDYGITGTASGFTDNWAVGGNDDFTWGIWVGRDVPARLGEGALARDTVLPIWLQLAQTLRSRAEPGRELPVGALSDTRSGLGDKGAFWETEMAHPVSERGTPHPGGVIPGVSPFSGEDAYGVLGGSDGAR